MLVLMKLTAERLLAARVDRRPEAL